MFFEGKGKGWVYIRYHESFSEGGGAVGDTMGLCQGLVGLIKLPWVTFKGWWADTIGIFQGLAGLQKILWISFIGWCGYMRYHGSLSGTGGATKDTMELFQGVVVL